MNGIDLFAGAGGLSAGARLAGLDVVHAVEKDPDAAAAYKLNFPEATVHRVDIRSLTDEDISSMKCDVILAGPPCQSFSTSNQRTRHDSNPLNDFIFEPVRFVQLLNPEFVVIENVHGLSIGTRRRYLNLLLEKLKQCSYNTQVCIISGADVGLPQNRNRVFIIGSKKYLPNINIGFRDGQPTVYDAIHDLPILHNGASVDVLPYTMPPKTKYAETLRDRLSCCTGHLVSANASHIIARYAYIPQGGNWRDIPASMMGTYKDRQRCHTGIYHRLRFDEPAKVIGNFRKNMLVHPTQSRGLSIREAARLQSFDDRHQFAGSIGKRQQQVGNAVPPIMAAALLSQILG
ncbi:DNA cytosine methyltransferase [Methylocystis sp. Sn-Cys]|uniref:DNA cytosine methyltransferase n=1 Tax=Methylocystis sp. Sn-Cys TaxID=1701263 RepID=UPI0019240990|nr:DNA cytosine methyltransferase [Methylocystis sp. Sn-Cys]MBL1258010.1 DNA cytosine methyltransferase [Methylocystis sp. Sn-Cys]